MFIDTFARWENPCSVYRGRSMICEIIEERNELSGFLEEDRDRRK